MHKYSENCTLLIVLKSKKFQIELDSEKQIDNLIEKLSLQQIVKIGPIVFDRSEFKYMEIIK